MGIHGRGNAATGADTAVVVKYRLEDITGRRSSDHSVRFAAVVQSGDGDGGARGRQIQEHGGKFVLSIFWESFFAPL